MRGWTRSLWAGGGAPPVPPPARGMSALLYGLGAVLFAYVFFQNAWVTDDAYITFRSVEQVMAGRGPRWNPHERVQVFTHPLWFILLVLARAFSRDAFLNATVLSLACGLAMLAVAAWAFRDARKWFFWVLLLAACKSLMDYTSSGLENPLSSLLLTLFFFFLVRGRPLGLFLVWGLLLTCQIDLLLVTLPAAAAVLRSQVREVGIGRAAARLAVGLSPFLMWTVFAVMYYGFPLSNPVYANLRTGLPLFPSGGDPGLLYRGAVYLAACVRYDPFILALGALTILAVRDVDGAGRAPRAWLGWGMLLHLLYVLVTGGDYMAGRLLTPALVPAAWAAAAWLQTERRCSAAVVLSVLAIVGNPLSPVKSTHGYANPRPRHCWVSDERALHFAATSLYQHLAKDPDTYFRQSPRTGRGYLFGLAFRRAWQRHTVHGDVGILGYTAGTSKIIVDPRGITDPLMARLPARPGSVPGRYDRAMPEGYPESVIEGLNRVRDPSVRMLYNDLRLVTRGPIFHGRRFRAMLRMNMPWYRVRPAGRQAGQLWSFFFMAR